MKILRLTFALILVGQHNLLAQSGWYSPTTTTDVLNTVFFVDSLNGWIGGSLSGGGVIRKTTDGGFTWNSQTLPVTYDISKIVFITHNIGFAVGGNGTILKTTNSGSTWVLKSSGTEKFLRSIFFLDDQLGWACGADIILFTTDQGETWITRPLSAIAHWDITFKNSQVGWVVGLYGSSYKSTNGGDSWTSIAPPISGRSLFGIFFPSPLRGIVIGGDQIALSTNGGDSWSTIYNSGGSQLNSISFADSLVGWVVGSNKIVKTTNGGSTWTVQSWPSPYRYLSAVHSYDPLHAWVVGDQIILKTTDGGGPTSVSLSQHGLPKEFILDQNFPNPFNPCTNIKFSIPRSEFVSIKIFSLLGQEIATLISRNLPAGTHETVWDAGSTPAGTYFYRLQTATFIQTRKLILIK